MALFDVTETNFEETIKAGIVLIDWWASWCGPCRAFAPVFEAAATRHPDVSFAKVNTEVERALAEGASIRSIPTLMAFRDGILLFEQAGALPGGALDELLEKVRALDMDAVRRQLASAAAAEATSSSAG